MADRNINASRKRILWCWRRYPVSRPEVAATPSITLIREFDVYLTKIDGSQHHGPINLSAADTLRQLSEAGRGRLSSGSQLRIVIMRRSMVGDTLPLRAASSMAFAKAFRTDAAGSNSQPMEASTATASPENRSAAAMTERCSSGNPSEVSARKEWSTNGSPSACFTRSATKPNRSAGSARLKSTAFALPTSSSKCSTNPRELFTKVEFGSTKTLNEK